jgi:signal transduction histidine kinase
MHRGLVPWFVLLICLAMTAAVTAFTAWVAREQQQLRFTNAAQDMEATIQSRLEIYVALLRGLSGFFAAGDEITRKDFHRYIGQLNVPVRYPGVQGIGFSRRLLPQEREPISRWMRAQGTTNFVIWPTTARPEYHAILLLELDTRNATALGYDMFTETVRSNAMAKARDTGAPAATGKAILVKESDRSSETGFLIYHPIYREGRTPATMEERRAALLGFVFARFRVDDLLKNVLANKAAPGLHLEIYDGNTVHSTNVLHRSATRPGRSDTLHAESRIEVAGRPWTLVFHSTRAFEHTPLRAVVPLTAIIGVVVSLMIFGLTWAQRRAQAAAQRTTAELAAAQEELHRHAAELERRVAERTVGLRESVKSLESLSYSIAHDLRAPLRTVHSFSDLLLHDYAAKLDDTARDYIQRMAVAAGRMDELIQDLLAYGQLTQENLPLEAVPLNSLLANTLEHMCMDIELKGADVRATSPLPAVRANRALLQQVFTNLLSNALKFVPENVAPCIEIFAETLDGKVRVSVRDNGIGIDPGLQQRIFGVFERLHSTEQFPGTGIGLAIVQKAIDRMSGKLGVESQPGQGSTFWFELPRASNSAPQPPRGSRTKARPAPSACS